MTRSPSRPALALAIEHGGIAFAARAGAFALPLLALLLATFDSAFVTVAQRIVSVAGPYALLP